VQWHSHGRPIGPGCGESSGSDINGATMVDFTVHGTLNAFSALSCHAGRILQINRLEAVGHRYTRIGGLHIDCLPGLKPLPGRGSSSSKGSDPLQPSSPRLSGYQLRSVHSNVSTCFELCRVVPFRFVAKPKAGK
jgi:hypothetical protein